MTTTAQATGAPVRVPLGDEWFSMSPLRDCDYGEFDRWLGSRIIRIARESLDDDMPQRDRDEVMRAAFAQASAMSIATEEGERIASTPDGIAMLLWLGIRQNHPDVTIDRVLAGLRDRKTVEHAMDMFDLANDLHGDQADDSKKNGEASDQTGDRSTDPSPSAGSTRWSGAD